MSSIYPTKLEGVLDDVVISIEWPFYLIARRKQMSLMKWLKCVESDYKSLAEFSYLMF